MEGQCQRCNKMIKYSGSSTTTLKNHLKSHGLSLNKATESIILTDERASEKRQITVGNFFAQKKLQNIVSDLATHGISIRAITRNKYNRQSIARDKFKLPANESDVMKLLHKDFNEKQTKKKDDTIKLKVANKVKFSMTFDEVTTLRGRRYSGVNIHDKTDKVTYKTGLIRILGSCSALDIFEIMKHLGVFGITMKKGLVASTQVGASVNKKYIRNIDIIDQFCLNHGLHLDVTSTSWSVTHFVRKNMILKT